MRISPTYTYGGSSEILCVGIRGLFFFFCHSGEVRGTWTPPNTKSTNTAMWIPPIFYPNARVLEARGPRDPMKPNDMIWSPTTTYKPGRSLQKKSGIIDLPAWRSDSVYTASISGNTPLNRPSTTNPLPNRNTMSSSVPAEMPPVDPETPNDTDTSTPVGSGPPYRHHNYIQRC